MKNGSKTLALLLAMALLLSLLSACGGSAASAAPASEAVSAEEPGTAAAEPEEPAAETAPEEAEASAEASAAEPEPEEAPVVHEEIFPLEESRTLSTYMTLPPTLMNLLGDPTNMAFFTWLKEKTNVDLQVTGLNLDAVATTYSLMFASNDYPSFYLSDALNQVPEGEDFAIESDLLINLADYDEELYWRYVERLRQMDAYEDAFTPDGNLVAFYKISDQPSMAEAGLMGRGDWLEAQKLSAPETLDELTEVLKTFKSAYSLDYSYILNPDPLADMNILQAFDTQAGVYLVGDEIRYGAVTDEFYDYISFLRGWYEDGLISDDFFSQVENSDSRSPNFEYVLNGTAGVWNASAQNMSVYMDYAPDDVYQVAAFQPPVRNKGDVQHFRNTNVLEYGWCIAPDVEDVEFVIQYLDYWYSDEVSHMASWGIEGEGFYYDEDGNEHFTEAVTNNPEGLGLNQAMQFFGAIRNGGYFEDYSRLFTSLQDYQIAAMETWSSGDDALVIPSSVELSAEELQSIAEYSNDVDTYIDEHLIEFIIGRRPLSDFRDVFVPALYDFGIQNTIDCWQAEYDAYKG